MISGPNRIVGWIGVAFSVAILIYGVWFAATLAAFSYAVPKFEQIAIGDSRDSIEARKGLLSSREVDKTFLNGYQVVFQELVDNPDNTFVAYSLFGAFFTVIYDQKGRVIARIDNGLDG